MHEQTPAATSAMAREIAEQPDAITRTAESLRPLGPEIRRVAGDRRHVLLIGRGTSDNAAVYGQYLLATATGRLATLASPSLATAYHARVDLTDVLAVGVSQSGDTAEIVETLEWARECGAATVAITNGEGSALARNADLTLLTRAGREVAVPATKTYTTQLTAMATLAFSLADDDASLDRLADIGQAVERMLDTRAVVQEWAGQLVDADRVVVSARGYAASTALELALKMKETCDVTAVGLSYADLLHGPIAIVRPGTPTFLLASPQDEAVLAGMTAVAERCREAGGEVFGIGGDAAFHTACARALAGPDVPATLAPIPLIVPGQLLTESLARAKGLDPDAPHGLRKVTQTA